MKPAIRLHRIWVTKRRKRCGKSKGSRRFKSQTAALKVNLHGGQDGMVNSAECNGNVEDANQAFANIFPEAVQASGG